MKFDSQFNQSRRQTLLDEEQRLLTAMEQLVAVVRIEKHDVVTNARLSGLSQIPSLKERQPAAKLKASFDRLQVRLQLLVSQVTFDLCEYYMISFAMRWTL